MALPKTERLFQSSEEENGRSNHPTDQSKTGLFTINSAANPASD